MACVCVRASGTFGPFLRLLTPDTLAVLALHTTVNAIMKEGPQGVPLARLLVQIGTAVQLEVGADDGREEQQLSDTRLLLPPRQP